MISEFSTKPDESTVPSNKIGSSIFSNSLGGTITQYAFSESNLSSEIVPRTVIVFSLFGTSEIEEITGSKRIDKPSEDSQNIVCVATKASWCKKSNFSNRDCSTT